jgi:hypothetical protein
MLYRYCGKFLEYCRLVDFSDRSIQPLKIRLGELRAFARTRKLKSIRDIQYLHLAAPVAEFDHPSVHLQVSRVRTLPRFYHFLFSHGYGETLPRADNRESQGRALLHTWCSAPAASIRDRRGMRPFDTKYVNISRTRLQDLGLALRTQ